MDLKREAAFSDHVHIRPSDEAYGGAFGGSASEVQHSVGHSGLLPA